MSDLNMFGQYYNLADQLIEKASKEEVAECARLLALNLAHYQMKYGELPLDETLAILNTPVPNAEQIEMLSSGMETLVGLLGNVVMGINESRH